MPAYDFRCSECTTVFEVVRPMGHAAEERCPECGAAATKVFSPVGVSFKGSGFHNTDYNPRPKQDEGCCSSADSSAGCATCPAAAAEKS